jgi:hypothetical protein
MLGNLPMGNNKITGLAAGTGAGDAATWAQLFGASTQADIASAATTDIGVQNTSFLRVTGTTTITSFGSNFRGPRFLTFVDAVTLTNSSTLVLPGNANITTAAGDSLIVIPGATLGTADKWVVMAYQKNAVPIDASTKLNTNNPSYTGTLTGGTGVVNLGSGQFYKDASGNVGIGATPSAWSAQAKALEIGLYAGFYRNASGLAEVAFNSYQDTSNNDTYRVSANPAGKYQIGGAHAWFTAPSGTAGNAISFTQAMTLDSSGNLLIGYTSSNGNFRLQVNSQIFATSSTIATSDGRYKEDVTPLTGALGLVTALNPVQFKWKEHPVHSFVTDAPTIGFIAQEVEEVLKDTPYINSIIKANECVLAPEVKDENGEVTQEAVTEEFLGIAEGNLIALLTAAIQEQQAIITALAARVESLEAKK